MSSLMVALGSLGGIVLAGVVAHGAWQARKAGPRRAAAPAEEPREQREPTLGDPSDIGKLAPDALAGVAIDPVLGMPERRPNKRGALRLDALIDSIVPLTLEAPVSGEMVMAHLPATRRAGGKPFLIEGLNADSGEWETPQAGQRYGEFQAGVQLANRSGPLNEIEYSEFVVKVQAFADAINGSPDFPDMLDEVARARELDQFASGHDAQLSFTLRAKNAAWSPGYVQQNASRLGFVAGAIPGRLVLPATASGSPPVLGLSFDTHAAMAEDPAQTALRAVTLSLDVPQVDRSEQPFVRMRDAAIALAATMDGLITDDNGQVIRADALDVIGSDLEQLYDTLDARDLAAGSPLARRLFS